MPATEQQILRAAVELVLKQARTTAQEPEAEATFAKAADAWLQAGQIRWAPSTAADYQAMLAPVDRVAKPRGRRSRAWIMRRLAGVPVREISREDVQQLLGELHEAGLSPTTVRKYAIVVGEILSYTGAEVPISKPRVRRPGKASLTMEQVRVVARCAPNIIVRHMILVASLAGVRQGELRALQVGDVDLPGRVLHVRQAFSDGQTSTPKSTKPRTAPLSDELVPLLTGLVHDRRPGDLLLPGARGGPASPTWIRNSWRKALAAAREIDGTIPESQGATWHSLRTSWASSLAAAGIPLPVVQRWGGWGSLAVLERYIGVQARQDDADRLSAALRLAA